MNDGPGNWSNWVVSLRGFVVVGSTRTRSHRGPEPIREDWPRPRRHTGPPVHIIGLRSEVNIDGDPNKDLQLREMRVWAKELADEQVARGAARYATAEEINKAREV